MQTKNRLSGFIFHKLRGIDGWSKFNISRIDVAKVNEMNCLERLFLIRDRDYKYTLEIVYHEPFTDLLPVPVFSIKEGVTITSHTTFTQLITKRYKTKEECMEEITNIHVKQYQIDQYVERLGREIFGNSLDDPTNRE